MPPTSHRSASVESRAPDLAIVPVFEQTTPARILEVWGQGIGSVALASTTSEGGLSAEILAPGERLLSNIRYALQSGVMGPRLPRSGVPWRWRHLPAVMEDIHGFYSSANPEASLPPHAPRRLLANIIKYQQVTGDGTANNLTFNVLSEIYSRYTADVAIFNRYGIAGAHDVALYHSPSIAMDLHNKYRSHAFITPAQIREAFWRSRSDPAGALERLEQSVAQFKAEIEPALRSEYGISGSWTVQFVNKLCETANPTAKARQIFEMMRHIQAICPRAKPRAIATWANEAVLEGGKHRARIDTLTEELPTLALDEEAMRRGTVDLDRLRQARRDGRLAVRQHTIRSAPVQRFLRIVDANWETAFDTLDIARAASYLLVSVRRYNLRLSKDEQHLRVNDAPENLLAMLLTYAKDVAALRQEGPERNAPQVAWYEDATVYRRYVAKYGNNPALTPSRIVTIVGDHPADPDKYILRHATRAAEIIAVCAGQLPQHAVHRFAEYSDGRDRALAYLDFAPQAQQIRNAEPWVSEHDILEVFLRSGRPADDVKDWIDKVKTLSRQYQYDTRFSLFINKRLARAQTLSLDANVANHLVRTREITDAYKGNRYITVAFAAYWSAFSPESYMDEAGAYLERVEEIEAILSEIGESVDYTNLRYIAFENNTPQILALRFVELRHALQHERQDDRWITPAMIDQAAAHSRNIGWARYQLFWLKLLNMNGLLEMSLDSRATGRSLHEETAGASPTDHIMFGDPQEIVVRRIERTMQRAQIRTFLSGLSPINRKAVRLVFGFDEDADPADVASTLGVSNLEDYVFDTLLPHIQNDMLGTVTN